jgi:hypothetical protein
MVRVHPGLLLHFILKLVPYVTPLFPPLAVFLGRLFLVSEGERQGMEGAGAGDLPVGSPGGRPSSFRLSCRDAACRRGVAAVDRPVPGPGDLLAASGPPADHGRIGRFPGIYLVSAMLSCRSFFPAARFLTPYKSALRSSRPCRTSPGGAEALPVRINLYESISTRQRTPVVDEVGELFYGALKLPESERQKWFMMFFEFFRFYRQGHEIYLVTVDGKCGFHPEEVPAMEIL